jgi:flagellar FliL protein
MAAENTPNPNESLEAGDASAPSAGRFSFLGKLKILLLVAVVVVLECLAAYLYLPSASQTAALAGAVTPPPAEAKTKAKAAGKTAAAETEAAEDMEVDLGEYCVTAFQSTSNSTLRIDFHLFGTVKADTQKDFLKLMEENKHRFREQVLVTIRAADITDLTDAGLGLMKRKLLDRANRTLGKPLLQTVVVSDFSFIEQ